MVIHGHLLLSLQPIPSPGNRRRVQFAEWVCFNSFSSPACHPSKSEKGAATWKSDARVFSHPGKSGPESSQVDCTFPSASSIQNFFLEEYVLYLKGRVVGAGRGGEEARAEARRGPALRSGGRSPGTRGPAAYAGRGGAGGGARPRRRAPERRGRGVGGTTPQRPRPSRAASALSAGASAPLGSPFPSRPALPPSFPLLLAFQSEKSRTPRGQFAASLARGRAGSPGRLSQPHAAFPRSSRVRGCRAPAAAGHWAGRFPPQPGAGWELRAAPREWAEVGAPRAGRWRGAGPGGPGGPAGWGSPSLLPRGAVSGRPARRCGGELRRVATGRRCPWSGGRVRGLRGWRDLTRAFPAPFCVSPRPADGLWPRSPSVRRSRPRILRPVRGGGGRSRAGSLR